MAKKPWCKKITMYSFLVHNIAVCGHIRSCLMIRNDVLFSGMYFTLSLSHTFSCVRVCVCMHACVHMLSFVVINLF